MAVPSSNITTLPELRPSGGNASPSTTGGPAYPVTRPAGHDDRLSISLVVDVAEVLHRHGFPAPARGRDLTELGDALSTFIYGGGA